MEKEHVLEFLVELNKELDEKGEFLIRSMIYYRRYNKDFPFLKYTM